MDKICARFKTATPQQARRLAFCLTLLPWTGDRTIRRLIGALPLYIGTLVDERVCKLFGEVIQKVHFLQASPPLSRSNDR